MFKTIIIFKQIYLTLTMRLNKTDREGFRKRVNILSPQTETPQHLPERVIRKDWPIRSEALNSDIYINECLEKRLLPFIREHHPDSNYIFWPDLNYIFWPHYSKQTVAWMDENVNFVPKEIHFTKCPSVKFTRETGRLRRSSS